MTTDGVAEGADFLREARLVCDLSSQVMEGGGEGFVVLLEALEGGVGLVELLGYGYDAVDRSA